MQAGGKYPSNEDGRVYFFFPKMGYPSGNFHEVGGRDKEVKKNLLPLHHPQIKPPVLSI